jgi:hypothetical protein
VLIYLSFVEKGLESQIENLGLNRVVMSQNLRGSDYAGGIPEPDPEIYSGLEAYGDVLPVQFSYGRFASDLGAHFAIGQYDADSIYALAKVVGSYGTGGTIIYSSTIPSGTPIRVQVGQVTLDGHTSPMPSILQIGGEENVVLIPKGSIPALFQSGFVNSLFFEKFKGRGDIVEIVRLVDKLHAIDYPTGSYPAAPVVSSAAKLAEELAAFRQKQAMLTAVLVSVVGGVIALVFGATAILEFRQSAFVCALLKSFGVGNHAILLQRLGEGLVIANAGLILVLAVIPALDGLLEGQMLTVLSGFDLQAIMPLFVCVNLGAILAVLPLSIGIRKPIGEVLS